MTYPWRPVSLAAGFQAVTGRPPIFRAQRYGTDLAGAVQPSAGGFTGTTAIASLPPSDLARGGARPDITRSVPVIGDNAGTPVLGRLTVDKEGAVTLQITADSVSLDGVRIPRGK